MYIDKELYQQAYAQYERWNEIEYAERIRNAGKLTHDEAWLQYVDLVEFLWQLCPKQSLRQQEQTIREWERYYSRIRRFEERRGKHGKTT